MLKNLISSFFTKSFVAFISLAILLVSSRYLGGAVVGQVSLFVLNLAIIQIVNDIYTGTALVYFIPKHNLGKIYSKGFVWTIGCIVVLNLIFFIFNTGIKELWLHVLTISFLSTLHAFHNVILLAKEKIKTYNFLILFQPALLLGVLVLDVFVFDLKDVNAYLVSAYVSWCISLSLSSFYVIKILKKSSRTEEIINSTAIFKNGFISQLGNLAHTLSNRYNYYMIASTVLIGVYASASSLVESIWIISGSVSPIILTHIANQTDMENNSRITLLLSKICFLLSILCVAVLFVIPADFFTWLLGKDFSGTKTIMLYLSPGILCISFSTIISHYFSGLGMQKVQLIANSLGLLVTLSTSYYFINLYGLKGACYSATLSYFMQTLVVTIVFMKMNKFKIHQLLNFRKDLELLKK